jgi:NAD(P)-dependent dehydrogenase (short-subunit alcohol dehydrogenase family)
MDQMPKGKHMRYDLKDKVVLITGASSGLGEALAYGLAREGARLALASRSLAQLGHVAAACRTLGALEARAYPLDVTRAADGQKVVEMVQKDLGRLDVLINNAGVHAFSTVAELPEGLFQQALEVNLFGPLRLIQAALPALRQSRGMVVNVGSSLAFRAIPNGAAYSAAKGALARLTEALRDEEARHGVHVLQIHPGVVLTKLRDNALSHGIQPEVQDKLPFPRTAEQTASEIIVAMRSKRRELISAAWPIRFWAKVLVPWFGGSVDQRMKLG